MKEHVSVVNYAPDAEPQHTASVTGQGPVEGCDSVALVLDYSNGNKVVMPVAQYYALGSIVPAEVHRYDCDETLNMLLEFRHYGSWHDPQ